MSLWSCHPVHASLGEHGAAWDALNQREFGGHPLTASSFVDPLLQRFQTGEVLLCVQRPDAGGEPEAMCLLRSSLPGVWHSFLPAQAQISPSLLGPGADLQGLLRALPGWVVKIDLLCIDPLHSRVADRASGTLYEVTAHALTMAVDLRIGYAEWWSSRPKKLRDNLGRYLRRAAEDGIPRFLAISEPAEVAAAVARYAALESRGWKGQTGTALDTASAQLPFYTDLLSSLAAQGRARVHELWLGNTLVASRLTMAHNGTVVALKTTYAEDFRRRAPGRLLMHDVIRDAFHVWPDHRFEFYTNASADQLAWATSQRQIIHVTAYRNRPALWLEGQRRQFRARLAWRTNQQTSPAVREVQTWPSAASMPDDVKALLAHAERERIGNGQAWYDNLVRTALTGEADIAFHVLRCGEQPVAVLPVRVSTDPAKGIQSLGTFYTAVYSPAIRAGESATALIPLVRHLRAKHPSAHQFRFAPMAPNSPGYTALRASLRASGLPTFEFFCHGNWYLPVSTDWPTYLAQRGGQLRTNIVRGEKRLASRGASIEIVKGGPALEDAIRAYQQVYSASWKRPEPHPEFMPGLIRLCAERGWLRLGLVRLDGQAIAAQVWIVTNDRAEIYKLAYDKAHKALGAGTVLTARLLEHAISVDRVTEIDYLIGDDGYKAAWMTHRRERWGLVAYNRRTLGGLLGWLRESLGRLRKRLARSPSPGSDGTAMPSPVK